MENLAPSLKFLLSLRYSMESGRSLNLALKDYLLNNRDEFAKFLLRWSQNFESGGAMDPSEHLKSPTQIVLVHLLQKGLQGQSIYSKLCEVEVEVLEECRWEMTSTINRLSFRLLVPLLLFQFPALLLLFLGFLTSQISRTLQ